MKKAVVSAPTKTDVALARNRECAHLILSDPARYGGDGSLPVEWARIVMGREAGAPCHGRR